MHKAYLIGLSQYPGHPLDGVPNDIELLTDALIHQNYHPSAIHTFLDTHTTLAELHRLFAQIRQEYTDLKEGSCYIHIGSHGAISLDPLMGGILPPDGDALDFSTAFSHEALNGYLPVRSGIEVIVTFDL